jgi:S-(hydroxymethyl)glutathione dehydrogenase/alcohol dehydrogenase
VGAAEIIGIDPIPLRRDAAQKLGATRVAESIDAARDTVAHLTNGQGADRVILTPGVVTGEIIRDGLDITGKGSVCVVVGMGPLGESPVPIDIGAFALWSKELRGCLFGSFDPRAAPSYLLELYGKGLLDLDAMITTYPLSDINRGLADSMEGRTIRSVLTMHG